MRQCNKFEILNKNFRQNLFKSLKELAEIDFTVILCGLLLCME